jgi:ABC-type lipoprotein export system ATPase subunit
MNDPRGSLWRLCDFHIHTPLSVLHHEFGDDFDLYVKTLFKVALEKNVEVIGVTDYFTIDGYKKIKQEYLENDSKLNQLFSSEEIGRIKNILILPNIEFRLNKIVQIKKTNAEGKTSTKSGRVNFHVIFSNEIPIKKIEENFLHDLDFIFEADPQEKDKYRKLKMENLRELGERLKKEQQDLHGSDVQIGMTNAVVDDRQIIDLLVSNRDFKDKYLIVIPPDEDLSEINWTSQDALTRKMLIQKTDAFFTSNSKTIAFGLGEKTSSPEAFILEFKSLKPSIWGSDAHNYPSLFAPSNDRFCWIKADPSFEGLRQILYEPKDRVFIGLQPPLFEKLDRAANNYIDELQVSSVKEYDDKNGVWFKDFTLKIGLELTAIIGNKGKGKSAIVDILGLLGNAQVEANDFSFLNEQKFCHKGYAENFAGKLIWLDGSYNEKRLNASINGTEFERVKYIPQAYLEKLCNSDDRLFKDEVNKVVFLRLDESDRLGKSDFKELISYRTEIINNEISELKVKLGVVNDRIISLERKSKEDYRKSVENKLAIKTEELRLHEEGRKSIKDVVDPETDGDFSVEQKAKSIKITELVKNINSLEEKMQSKTAELGILKFQLSEVEKFLEEINATEARFQKWREERVEKYKKYNLEIDEVIKINVKVDGLKTLIESKKKEIRSVNVELSPISVLGQDNAELSLSALLKNLRSDKEKIELELDKPLKEYQIFKQRLKEWDTRKKAIEGDDDTVTEGSIKFYENEISYLNKRLAADLQIERERRKDILKSVYQQKQFIQEIYNKIKTSISDVLLESAAEQSITIETSFKMDQGFYLRFFDYVYRYGDFHNNGDEHLRKTVINYNFDNEEEVIDFIDQILSYDIRIKEGRVLEFYNYLFSLDFLNPEYDLRLNNKSLSKLSPGEKGGLLLVFYLVLDRDNKPLIIDQPEDNLDNQSVAEILVPYIKKAKRDRQIIMVTHNPNLAIVADAEQIVYMDIDKDDNYKVSCDSDGIENVVINNRIVDILEGKMKAFNTRRIKYRG